MSLDSSVNEIHLDDADMMNGSSQRTTRISTEDYSLLKSVHAWVFPDIQPVPELTGPNSLWRTFTFDTISLPVHIQQNCEDEGLVITHPGESSVASTEQKIRTVLGLDVETQGAIDEIRQDEDLMKYADDLQSLRPYQTDTVFESIIKSIIQQQISFRGANSITKRLILATQKTLVWNGNRFFGFPSFDSILNLGLRGLRGLGLGHKAEYIFDICKLIDKGAFLPESLRQEPYSSVASILGEIRGIGPWTINAVAISGLGLFEIFPYSDLGIRNIVGRFTRGCQRASIKQVIRFKNRFGDHGDLVLYLLMCAEVLGILDKES